MNLNKIKFGSHIRDIRLKQRIGQRELAAKIGIAASYLNDIEKNKRTAPKISVINKISKILEIEKLLEFVKTCEIQIQTFHSESITDLLKKYLPKKGEKIF